MYGEASQQYAREISLGRPWSSNSGEVHAIRTVVVTQSGNTFAFVFLLAIGPLLGGADIMFYQLSQAKCLLTWI